MQCLSGRIAYSHGNADDSQAYRDSRAATSISVDGTVVAQASGVNDRSQTRILSTHKYGYYQCGSSYVGALKKGQVVKVSMTSSSSTGSYYYDYSDYDAWFIPE